MKEIDIDRLRKYLSGYSRPDFVALLARMVEELDPDLSGVRGALQEALSKEEERKESNE